MDQRVRGPFGISWYGEPGPRERIDRHATPPMPLMVDGVVFTIGYDLVMAFDAYNGVRLWTRTIDGATREGLPLNTSNIVADGESLFIVVDDHECLRLDASTGRTLQRYEPPRLPKDEYESDSIIQNAWGWIARSEKILYGSVREHDPERILMSTPPLKIERTLMAAQSSQVASASNIFMPTPPFTDERTLMAAQPGQVASASIYDGRRSGSALTFPDQLQDEETHLDRHGRPIPPDIRKLVALDAVTGETLWELPFNASDLTLDDEIVQGRGGVACMLKDGILIVHGTGSLGHPHSEFLAGRFTRRAIYAFDAATGRILWGGRKGYRKRPIIVGDHVYAEPFGWDLMTGDLIQIENPLSGRPQTLDFHRGYIGCGHLLGSASTIFGAKEGISYFNLDERSGFTPFSGMALACGLGIVPAGGVLIAPEGRSGCTCATPIYTSIGLYPKPETKAWGVGFTGERSEVVSFPVERVSINLGAPGYREDEFGELWIPYPARVDHGLIGDWLPNYQHDADMCFRLSEYDATVQGTNSPWMFSSGYEHDKPLSFRLLGEEDPPATYTVRLYFIEPDPIETGERVFNVRLQDETVLDHLDIVAEAGGPRRPVVREFQNVAVKDILIIVLEPSEGFSRPPLLCGLQAVRE